MKALTHLARLLAVTLVVTLLAPASAAPPEGTPPAPKDAPPAKIEVKSPHVRLLPPTAPNTGAFMVIENHGDADVKLVRASNPVSRATELHTHLDEGGVKKMRQVPFILVPAGGQALLQPGGFHVMLIGLERPLREDEVIPLTLGFDDGTELVVEAPVKRPVAPAHAPK